METTQDHDSPPPPPQRVDVSEVNFGSFKVAGWFWFFFFFFFQNSCCFENFLFSPVSSGIFCSALKEWNCNQQNKLLKMSVYTRFPRVLDTKASTIKDSISWVQGIMLGPHRAFLPWVNSVVLATQPSSIFLSGKKNVIYFTNLIPTICTFKNSPFLISILTVPDFP